MKMVERDSDRSIALTPPDVYVLNQSGVLFWRNVLMIGPIWYYATV